jgi:translation initiation factor IF-2
MSDKVRVYEIAEEAGATSTDIMSKAKDLGIELKSPQSAVTIEEAEEVMNYILTGKSKLLKKKSPKKPVVIKKATEEPKEEQTVQEVKKEEPVAVAPQKTKEETSTKKEVKPALKTRGKIKKVSLNTTEPKATEPKVEVEKPAKVEQKEQTVEKEPVKQEVKVEAKEETIAPVEEKIEVKEPGKASS